MLARSKIVLRQSRWHGVASTDTNRYASLLLSVNTRLLYRKLLATAVRQGTEVLTRAEIELVDGSHALVRLNNEVLPMKASLFVYSAGYGAKRLFERLHKTNLPIRYWRSHLVVTQRLAPMGVFSLDPQEAAFMNHGEKSIVGLNEDAVQCLHPNYDVIEQNASRLRGAITRMFPTWQDASAFDVACTKVDLASDASSPRSLNIAVIEPVPNHICVLPGKMTEAPFVTDAICSLLHERLNEPSISMRPCDSEAVTTARMEIAVT